MKKVGSNLDRAAGRIYTRVLAILTAIISAIMLVSALFAWRISGPVAALIWLLGALLFGFIARASWRSRAGLSDIDFTG